MAIFNSFLYVYQRVLGINSPLFALFMSQQNIERSGTSPWRPFADFGLRWRCSTNGTFQVNFSAFDKG
jgi:hypothetical protein